MPGATITVGNVEITAVHDNEGALPLSMVFPGVEAELWVPYQQKYPECFNGDNNENFAAHFDCYVIRSGGQYDTGRYWCWKYGHKSRNCYCFRWRSRW